MGGQDPLIGILEARGMVTLFIAQAGNAPGFVVGGPVFDAIAETLRHRLGVLEKGLGHVPRGPAPLVLQDLGQIPMIESAERGDPGFQEPVHQGLVEVEPLGLMAPRPSGRILGQAMEKR